LWDGLYGNIPATDKVEIHLAVSLNAPHKNEDCYPARDELSFMLLSASLDPCGLKNLVHKADLHLDAYYQERSLTK
jgi:hypothetical protein